MNRVIKYRVWNKENEEYINGCDVLLKYDGSAVSRYALGALDTDMPVNVIIEQYTGLKDQNGKEIYEGDIVRQFDDEEYFVVKFEYGGFLPFTANMMTFDVDYCEVIGNIHENPELLDNH